MVSSAGGSAPLGALAFFAVVAEAALVAAAFLPEPLTRAALAVGTLGAAVLVLPGFLGHPAGRGIVVETAKTTAISDTVLIVASQLVWRQQTGYESIALEVFSKGSVAAAAIAALGTQISMLGVTPQWLATITQLAASATQLFLSTVIFTHASTEEFVTAVPIFILAGFAMPLYWRVARPPAGPAGSN